MARKRGSPKKTTGSSAPEPGSSQDEAHGRSDVPPLSLQQPEVTEKDAEGDFVNNSLSKGDNNITNILPTFTSEAEKIDHDTKETLDGEAAGLLNSADVFKNERVHLCKY